MLQNINTDYNVIMTLVFQKDLNVIIIINTDLFFIYFFINSMFKKKKKKYNIYFRLPMYVHMVIKLIFKI